MTSSRFNLISAATRPSVAVVVIITALACRPLKIDQSKKTSDVSCPANSIIVGSTCIKDGFIYLLHEAVQGKLETAAGKTSLTFGKQSLVKGDRIFATSRVTYAKGTNPAKATSNFQIGSTNIGTPSAQYVGDSDTISAIRHSMTHSVADSSDTLINFSISPVTAQPVQAEGTLLIFRQTQVAYALDSKVQKPGMSPYFTSQTIDTDKIKTPELTVSPSATPLAEIESKDLKQNDILLIRSGTAWSTAEGKANACEGAAVTLAISIDQKEQSVDGPHTVSAARPIGYSSIQAFFKIPTGGTVGKVSLTAKLQPGSAADKNNCALKITEPTTLSVVVFRPLSDLYSEVQTARYLHDLGAVTEEATKFISNPSGPPIETLISFNWEHLRGDALLTDAIVNLAAEDRVQPTKAFLQLSRAPDGLSSHVSKAILMDPEKPRTLVITDMAVEQELATQTRFYLTGMAYNNDSRNVFVNEAKIFFMHFRRIGDRL